MHSISRLESMFYKYKVIGIAISSFRHFCKHPKSERVSACLFPLL
ncbi:unnamed protein product [Taenia asiatica]|uniref:Uncharacterized protein n=1 Tax=Taenia asiatica TaxID=60517 RepID=A0A3P6PL39_TAEAS|nr:unnamed protein product [Taenia asiatica]